MEITDLHGVGPVMAMRLESAGIDTVAAVAGATIAQLREVPGIGEQLAARLHTEAQRLVWDQSSPTAAEHERAKHVAKSVKRLHRAIPGLAKSKKEAKRLKTATKRMTGWVQDLGHQHVREQFIAEVTRIGESARKRTGSKKGARKLREHATRIEYAVREVG